MSALSDMEPARAPATEIPVLDLGPYMAGEDGSLEALAAALRHAQEDVGFFYIVNHGVPKHLITGAYGALRRFFAMPTEEKLKLRVTAQSVGFVPAKSTVYVTSTVNANTKPDLNEVVLYTRERGPGHPRHGERFHGPNPWPDETVLPGFRDTMLAYYDAAEALGRSLLPVYARALDLPADWFDPYFEDPMWTTRNGWYPGALDAEENQFGLSPHRDHSFITLLPLSEEPGLQILTPGGEWIAAEQIEDAIIVNTGEFMHRWTNGRFIATPHRVVPPKHDRYSIAFFFNPTCDTMAEPLPTCISEENPPRFEPVSMRDYLAWYIDRNFSKDGGGRQEEYAAEAELTR